LGFFVIILPFLGFPSAFKTFLFVFSGFVIIFLFFSIAGDYYRRLDGTTKIKEDNKIEIEKLPMEDKENQNDTVL